MDYRILNRLVHMLEAMRIGPLSPKGVRMEKAFQRDLSKYFRKLERDFPMNRVKALVLRKQESKYRSLAEANTEVASLVDDVVSANSQGLRVILETNMYTAITIGAQQAQATVSVGVLDAVPLETTQTWLQSHIASTVTKIDAATQQRLAGYINTAIAEGWSSERLASVIATNFDNMSKKRALTIARTELCDAMSQAQRDAYEKMGFETHIWEMASGACPTCQENDGVERKIGEPFPTGDTQPSAHPNCRCALSAGRLKK